MNDIINLAAYGYAGLFVASFLAATILPFGAEPLLVVLIKNGFEGLAVVLVATIGNYLGACTTYYIGLVGRRDLIEKYLSISQEKLDKAEKSFKNYGVYLLLFTWVPFIGDAIAAIGGIMKLDFKIFSFFVFVGKLLRYALVAYLTFQII